MPATVEAVRVMWPVAVETLLVLAAIRIAFSRPNIASGYFRRLELAAGRLARRRGLAILVVILTSLGGRAALSPILPIRAPAVHDEFSYLLLADTFASGRLSNPAHPMWMHFESFHINQQPTYGSMYQVGQGAVLATGQAIAGHPWFGVWLSAGLMCGAICWMLQGWLPPGWALLGGLLVVIRLGLFSYWMNSYFGGSVSAIGGALVLGALPRIKRKVRLRDGIWLATGAAILANSRPYEGLLVCAATLAIIVWWLASGRGPALRQFLLRAVIPGTCVLAAAGCFVFLYQQRATGNGLLSPYQLNRSTYGIEPIPFFIWQSLLPAPTYHHSVMKQFYLEWEAVLFLRAKSWRGFAEISLYKLRMTWLFFLGPPLTIALLMLPNAVRDRRVRPLFWVALVFTLGMAVQPWFSVHYAGAITGLLFVILMQSARHLRQWRRGGKPVGQFLVRAIPLICVVSVGVRILARPDLNEWDSSKPALWCCVDAGNTERSRIVSDLEARGGRHLLIVRYKPDHNYHNEWVYNKADIDGSKVVFAREMDPVNDAKLIEYFKDRKIWMLEPDENPVKLSPYGLIAPK